VFDETNGSQVEQVNLDELDDEEAPCVALRNMSIATEPPKSFGPPTVVLVQRTLDNPVDAHNHSTSSVFVPFFLAQERFTRHADITAHRRNE
jgi:hypothetical protein